MKRSSLLLMIFFIAGCRVQGQPSRAAVRRAIDNLSATTEQLQSIRREKDLFARVLDDVEDQENLCSKLSDCNAVQLGRREAMQLWHDDIQKREEIVQRRHALNTLIAHIKIEQTNSDPNRTVSSGDSK